jgi:two-component system copper resistance phosphate regulon response regulator CusR
MGTRVSAARPPRPTISSSSICGYRGRLGWRFSIVSAKGFEKPVLVLTAQDAVDAKVATLRAGADDYVTKPFAFEELLARVEALSRRPQALAPPKLVVGDLELDQSTREVRRSGEPIELTPKEYTVLEYLMRHSGRVMSRTLITEYAWGYHFDPGTNIVDVVINHLRKKVDAKHSRKLINTVRGVGYMIKDDKSGRE